MDITEFIATLRTYAHKLVQGESLSGEQIASVVQRITELECEEGGPYGVLDNDGTLLRDSGLNLSIAEFLAANDLQLPNLDAFIDSSLARGDVTSEYVSAQELLALVHAYHSRRLVGEEAIVASFTESEAAVVAELMKIAEERFTPLALEMRHNALEVLRKTLDNNVDKQIALMPYYLRGALGPAGTAFTDTHLAHLGFLNFCFWSSTIIYDDFWDEDEVADPRLLPIANLFAREYIDQFLHFFPAERGFRTFFHTAMDNLDQANAWETQSCRMKVEGTARMLPIEFPEYGDYSRKFYPASGHIFAPLILLMEVGYEIDSPEAVALVEYLKHYLIAMQLNDDAHDWKEDLERGHISTAVTALLKNWKRKHPDRISIDVVKDQAELEQIFWYEELVPLCTLILEHTKQSQEALDSLASILPYPAALHEYILRNERAAQKALREQKQSVSFISAYHGVPY